MAKESIVESKENFNEALVILQNIIEGDSIGRFKFTSKEKTTLLFIADLLAANLKELENLSVKS